MCRSPPIVTDGIKPDMFGYLPGTHFVNVDFF